MSILSTLTGYVYLAAASPSPVPKAPPADEVTPGPWGFIAIFGIGVVVALLIVDMNRRVRRVRYRAEVAEKLDAESREAAEQDDAPRP